VLSSLHPLIVPSQEYPFSLATCFRLYDESLSFLIIELYFKVFAVLGQEPCLGEEVILAGNYLLHAHEVLRKQVLPCETVHPWEVVGSLVVLHLHEEVGRDWPVQPPNVPVLLLIVAERIIQFI
jgi:hypothetical protein